MAATIKNERQSLNDIATAVAAVTIQGAKGDTGSGNVWAATTVTNDYTILSDNELVLVNAATGKTMTLPLAADMEGMSVKIKNIHASHPDITVATTDSETINDAATATITGAYAHGWFYSNGTKWYTI